MNRGKTIEAATRDSAPGKWFFLCAFIFACSLFWWLPSLVFRFLAGVADGVESSTVTISIIAVALFSFAYLTPVSKRPSRRLTDFTVDQCTELSYFITVALFFPALLLAIRLWSQRAGGDYADAGSIPIEDQAVLYTHLFFGLMFLGSADPQRGKRRRVLLGVALFTLPRLVISMHGGRFYLAQAVVPALLIAIGRGWVRFTFWRVLQIVLLAALILFGPSISRGDPVLGQGEFAEWLGGGSTLKLYQDHVDDSLQGHCSPFLVAFTAKVIPYKLMGECVIDFGDRKGEPETLDRILAVDAPGSFQGTFGPGSNYLLDLELFGGLCAVFAGTAFFGFSCRRFLTWIGRRSPYAGIWAECLTRALFAPRGNLGYVYERVPSLVLTTWLVILAVKSCQPGQLDPRICRQLPGAAGSPAD